MTAHDMFFQFLLQKITLSTRFSLAGFLYQRRLIIWDLYWKFKVSLFLSDWIINQCETFGPPCI